MYTRTQTAGQDTKAVSLDHADEEKLKDKQKPKVGPKPQRTSNDTYYNVDPNAYYNSTDFLKAIPVDQFKSYVSTQKQKEKLISEYESIPYGMLHPTTEARRQENVEKNRFKSTFPYDHSRVILTRNGQNKSDYINANYVNGIVKNRKYIATQGPLLETLDDFWRMVWQTNVGKIVMLTGIVEGGRNKCAKYWPQPNETINYGGLHLTTLDERKYSYYTLREIRVQDNKSKQTRRILHYHYTAWPDHDVTNPVLLVQFHQHVMSTDTKMSGPLLVHCSAGIGRTGTFIGLDELLREANSKQRINVEYYVKKMRECRMNMIQKPAQYVLLHEALVEALQLPKSAIKMSEFPAEWTKIQADTRPVNQQRLRREYETLKSMKISYENTAYKSANSGENKHKNRPKSSLALDEYRPYLEYVRGYNDYINAVIVPSYTSDTGFFVTQQPVADTVVDLWRLVSDHDSKVIVHFESNSEDKTPFYPDENDEMDTDLFSLSTSDRKTFQDSVVEYDVVLFSKEEEEEVTINVIKVLIGDNNSSSCAQLSTVAELANNARQMSRSGPITVVSSDGSSCCDVFCAFMNIMENMQVDNELDIFQTVRQLQVRRPEFFSDYENYRLCYEAVNHHLTINNVYFN